MPFVNTVRIVKAEYSAIIHPGQMGKQESEIVANHLVPVINPNLFAKDAETATTPKSGFVIGILAKPNPLAH
jgi:hypothetical protein